MLSIGEMSRRSGVKVPTIRYYEQMGLIAAPERSAGNQRRYTRRELDRLTFIRHARDLGLSLDAIRELLRLNENPEMPCADAHAIATAHLADIRARIARLERLERELTRIEASCDAECVGECNILHVLSDHALCETEH
ncbi:MerR family transcriptional regulator [Oricola thermophila]|uniref:Helix-turn-helix domain-containing protein n=1 Tax=Oricola thermophila TaxID=2742145 RepID=A0A6N1VED2_9HYPH|nr:helix-turn-helix domain-containing protein [Oricola thermophila]QKV19300.1 helix-turn-helix domain-containing protein [Oricola thermophila]